MLINESQFAPGVAEPVILSRVRAFVNERGLHQQRGFVISEKDRLIEKVALDTRYLAAIIDFIQDEFGVHVSDCEITEENLGSLRAVARFVANKQPFAVG